MFASIAPSGTWPKAGLPCTVPSGHPLRPYAHLLPGGVVFQGSIGFAVDRVKGKEIEVGPQHMNQPQNAARWGIAEFTMPAASLVITGFTVSDRDGTPSVVAETALRDPTTAYAEATTAQLQAALAASITEMAEEARAAALAQLRGKIEAYIHALTPPRRWPDTLPGAALTAVNAALDAAGLQPPAP